MRSVVDRRGRACSRSRPLCSRWRSIGLDRRLQAELVQRRRAQLGDDVRRFSISRSMCPTASRSDAPCARDLCVAVPRTAATQSAESLQRLVVQLGAPTGCARRPPPPASCATDRSHSLGERHGRRRAAANVCSSRSSSSVNTASSSLRSNAARTLSGSPRWIIGTSSAVCGSGGRTHMVRAQARRTSSIRSDLPARSTSPEVERRSACACREVPYVISARGQHEIVPSRNMITRLRACASARRVSRSFRARAPADLLADRVTTSGRLQAAKSFSSSRRRRSLVRYRRRVLGRDRDPVGEDRRGLCF